MTSFECHKHSNVLKIAGFIAQSYVYSILTFYDFMNACYVPIKSFSFYLSRLFFKRFIHMKDFHPLSSNPINVLFSSIF